MDEQKTVKVGDVDDVIELAARYTQRDDDLMTGADLVDIGQQLDLAPAAIEEAVQELHRRRAIQKEEQEQSVARMAARKKLAIVFGVGTVVLLGLSLVFSNAALSTRYAVVEEHAGLVREAMTRAEITERNIATLELDATGRAGEVLGAQNRITVERRRYDQAVADYNQVAGGLFGGIARALSSKPASMPRAAERSSW